MTTDGTSCRTRSCRWVARVAPSPPIWRRSLAIRLLIRRRSVSILVSPGPRVPMPPPPATRPPACRDIDSPQPRSRGSMYCSWASSTCALPSRLRACWAKMSRISAVRSMTLTLTTSSSWRSWPGVELAVADHGVGAGGHDDVAQLLGLAGADVGRRVRPVAPLHQALQDLGAGRLGQPGELGQRVLRVGHRAGGPDADEHDALQPELPVLDLGDVGELGREARDAAERLPVLEVVRAVRVDAVEGRPGWMVEWVGHRPPMVSRGSGRRHLVSRSAGRPGARRRRATTARRRDRPARRSPRAAR